MYIHEFQGGIFMFGGNKNPVQSNMTLKPGMHTGRITANQQGMQKLLDKAVAEHGAEPEEEKEPKRSRRACVSKVVRDFVFTIKE